MISATCSLVAEVREEPAEADEAHGGDGEAHDRAAEEGDREGRGGALVLGGEGGADVGLGGGHHADEAGHRAAEGTEEEGDGLLVAVVLLEEEDRGADDDGEDGDQDELAAHEDHRAAGDLVGDLGHLALAAGAPGDGGVEGAGDEQAGKTGDGCDDRGKVHGWL